METAKTHINMPNMQFDLGVITELVRVRVGE